MNTTTHNNVYSGINRSYYQLENKASRFEAQKDKTKSKRVKYPSTFG